MPPPDPSQPTSNASHLWEPRCPPAGARMPAPAAPRRHAGPVRQQPAQQGHPEPAARAVHADEEVGWRLGWRVGAGQGRAGGVGQAAGRGASPLGPSSMFSPSTRSSPRHLNPSPPPSNTLVAQHRATQRRVLPVRHRGVHAGAGPAGGGHGGERPAAPRHPGLPAAGPVMAVPPAPPGPPALPRKLLSCHALFKTKLHLCPARCGG